MSYTFVLSTDLQKYGAVEGLFIGNLRQAIATNKQKKIMKADGRTWSHASLGALALAVGTKVNKVRRVINCLIKAGVIVREKRRPPGGREPVYHYAFVNESAAMKVFRDSCEGLFT